MGRRLPRSFYAQCTTDVARQLLGHRLVHQLPSGQRLSGRIVETEAYLGIEDPACHSFGGRRTARTEVMYGDAGLSYVYFIYGMYFCFNVTTVRQGVPEAVLVRALEIIEGREQAQAQWPRRLGHQLANGPGKLCSALGLGRTHNGLDLTGDATLFIEEDGFIEENGAVKEADVIAARRVGIGDRHGAARWPLRFGLKGHPALSRPPFA